MRISDWSSDVCSSDLPARMSIKAASPFAAFNNASMRFQFVSPTTSHSPLRSGNTHSLSLGHQRQITRQKGVTIASVMIDCTTRMAQVTLGVIPRPPKAETGRASCRERVCQYVEISGVGGQY